MSDHSITSLIEKLEGASVIDTAEGRLILRAQSEARV